MKCVLGGPPKSGKSCSREGLKQAIRAIPGSPYPYIITGCPDGEGAWYFGAAAHDPVLARALKEAYKAKFTPEFAQRVAVGVRNCTLPCTVIDIGGRISDENRCICEDATNIVLIVGDDPETGESWKSRIVPWRAFAAEMGLAVVAEVYSDYHGQADTPLVQRADGVWAGGSIHYLERGEDVSVRPTMRQLAQILVGLAQQDV